MVRSLAVAVGVIAIALAGCASGSASAPAPSTTSAAPSAPPSTPAPSPSPSPSAAPAIVGEWVGTHECDRIVTMLTDAGLDEFLADAVYGNGLVPGDPNGVVADPTTVCEGAVDRPHSHFFTADGAFGSKDFNGETVDGGTYSLRGVDTIVINSMRFRYSVEGDTLTLEPDPVDISACPDRECRFYATWVLMVAMPGTTWTRGQITPS